MVFAFFFGKTKKAGEISPSPAGRVGKSGAFSLFGIDVGQGQGSQQLAVFSRHQIVGTETIFYCGAGQRDLVMFLAAGGQKAERLLLLFGEFLYMADKNMFFHENRIFLSFAEQKAVPFIGNPRAISDKFYYRSTLLIYRK